MSWIGQKPRGNVTSSYRGNRTITYYKADGYWQSLGIINESLISTLRFRVNGIEIAVLPRGTFDDDFDNFNTVEILNNVSHSIVMRG
jgi:hypothetical protein